jgi:Zn-finger nucleic acid-binding protein
MRVYERSGVTVDRCTECGGIFLDRGELDHLIRMEGEYTERQFAQASRYRDDNDDDDYKRRGSGDDTYREGGYRKKKRKNFLEDLFDFG